MGGGVLGPRRREGTVQRRDAEDAEDSQRRPGFRRRASVAQADPVNTVRPWGRAKDGGTGTGPPCRPGV
jgi:hypothetical protein